MSLQLCRRAELSPEQIAGLEQAMTAFYQNTPASYYQIADQVAGRYNPGEYPFHWDLIGRVFSGATVLEVGCGTAHLCQYVEEKGGFYTGLDHSDALLQNNRQRFPKARFFQLGTSMAEDFDIVASICVVEHVVDPPAYLESLWRYCKPGGLIVIHCPEFIDSPGFPPSIYFGRTPRRFREKLRTLDFADACSHLMDWKIRAPLWKRRLRAGAPGAFWLNLAPGMLHGAGYSIDADAIHLVRLKDLVWFFEQKNARMVQTSANMPGIAPGALPYGCHVVVQKPDSRFA
ncbi:MAG: class I SAM-dependent methyltransferase [Verrucomicrobiota bacterium]|jgi:SAM-dependent methyltransferase